MYRLDVSYPLGYEAAMKQFDEIVARLKRGIKYTEDCTDPEQFILLAQRMKEVIRGTDETPGFGDIFLTLIDCWLKTIYQLSKEDENTPLA